MSNLRAKVDDFFGQRNEELDMSNEEDEEYMKQLLAGPTNDHQPTMNRKKILDEIELPDEFQAKRVSRKELNAESSSDENMEDDDDEEEEEQEEEMSEVSESQPEVEEEGDSEDLAAEVEGDSNSENLDDDIKGVIDQLKKADAVPDVSAHEK